MRNLLFILLFLIALSGCSHKPMYGTHADIRVHFMKGYGEGATDCGTIVKVGAEWAASPTPVFLDPVPTHFFASREEAEVWLGENWCRP